MQRMSCDLPGFTLPAHTPFDAVVPEAFKYGEGCPCCMNDCHKTYEWGHAKAKEGIGQLPGHARKHRCMVTCGKVSRSTEFDA